MNLARQLTLWAFLLSHNPHPTTLAPQTVNQTDAVAEMTSALSRPIANALAPIPIVWQRPDQSVVLELEWLSASATAFKFMTR
jgi:hypothetical protein